MNVNFFASFPASKSVFARKIVPTDLVVEEENYAESPYRCWRWDSHLCQHPNDPLLES
jgi:hypothetical protein